VEIVQIEFVVADRAVLFLVEFLHHSGVVGDDVRWQFLGSVVDVAWRFGSCDPYDFLDDGDGLEDLTESEIVAVIYSAILVQRWLWGNIRLGFYGFAPCQSYRLRVPPLPVVSWLVPKVSECADHSLDVCPSSRDEAFLDLFPSRLGAEDPFVFHSVSSQSIDWVG